MEPTSYEKIITKEFQRRSLVMLGFILLLITGSIIEKNFRKNQAVSSPVSPDLVLKNIPVDKPKTLPKLPTPVHVATVKVTPPTIVKDKLVINPPPDLKQIEAALIDVKTIDGRSPA